MRRALTAVARLLNGLRRPSKAANLRRLRTRGESLASFRIREATLEDVPDLAQLHFVTFNATYGLAVGRRPTVELRTAQWREKLGGARGDVFCFLVEHPDRGAVGFASGERGDYPGYAGRLDKIYLLAEYQRLGLGRRLVGHVTRRFLAQGISSMMLFSEVGNPSCRFFEALGGERLLSESGEFHGAYGWRDLRALSAICPAD